MKSASILSKRELVALEIYKQMMRLDYIKQDYDDDWVEKAQDITHQIEQAVERANRLLNCVAASEMMSVEEYAEKHGIPLDEETRAKIDAECKRICEEKGIPYGVKS